MLGMTTWLKWHEGQVWHFWRRYQNQKTKSTFGSDVKNAQHQASREQESSPPPQVNEEAVPERIQDEETSIWLTPAEMEKLEELHDHEFIHTKVISLDFLQSIGLDDELTEVFKKMGWDEFWDLSNVKGSKILPQNF